MSAVGTRFFCADPNGVLQLALGWDRNDKTPDGDTCTCFD